MEESSLYALQIWSRTEFSGENAPALLLSLRLFPNFFKWKNETVFLRPWKNKDKWVDEYWLRWTFSCWRKSSRTLTLPSFPFCQRQWSHRSVITQIQSFLDPWPWNLKCCVLHAAEDQLFTEAKQIEVFHLSLSAVIPSSYFVSLTYTNMNCSRTSLYFFVIMCTVLQQVLQLHDEGDAVSTFFCSYRCPLWQPVCSVNH